MILPFFAEGAPQWENSTLPPGSLLGARRFLLWGLLALVLLAGLGELIIQFSTGLALSILLLVLVWGGVFAYLARAAWEMWRERGTR